jgi:N-acylneuraminate cytidylyltransferase
MKPEVLAIVPARGGSKSIPRKNLLPICGRPLIAHSIEHALSSKAITRTIVSTDDPEIAEVAARHGAEVPFLRPAQLAGDESTDFEVIEHALSWLFDEQRYSPDLVVHLRPTEPVRDVRRIDAAIRMMLVHTEADSLRSVSVADQSPYKMWRIQQGYLRPVVQADGIREAHSAPRQKLPLVYRQNGYVDIVRPRTILEHRSICGANVMPFFVDHETPGLDYPEQVADVEAALRVGAQPRSSSWIRHPA